MAPNRTSMEIDMNIVKSFASVPQRLRANYRARKTASLLESLPEEIRKDIGWKGSFETRNW
jgi:hypothetical protein